MKLRGCVRNSFKLGLAATALLVLPLVASAQDDTPKALPAVLGAGLIGFIFICFLAVYVYMELALQTIAQKTNTGNGWFAWIPIANIILVMTIAKNPIYGILVFLDPLL